MLDIIILMIIVFGALIGFKRGIIKQGLVTIGMVLVIILSFALKNPVSAFMYKNFPFFSFNGLYENISVLNILLYEVIAFSLVFSILSTILLIAIRISKSFDKILRLTFIFALPSRILGAILGAIEYYLIVFIGLFVLMQPMFELQNSDLFSNSKLKDTILSNTPFVSSYIQPTIDTVEDIEKLIENKDNYSDKTFNCKVTNIMVKNKVIEKKSLDYLYSSGKIKNKCKIGD
ncbi:MAG: CvpA family protein [Bacilli bacterium]|nr:CvpA family protein [Bacilli bacterium]